MTKNYIVSNHAAIRSQQRGIKKEVINIILNEADKVENRWDGASALYVSKKKLKKLFQMNIYPNSLIEKVSGVVLIEKGEDLLTVFHQTRRIRAHC